MMYTVFSVYDSKAKAFLPPFVLPRIEQAKRIFSDCCNADNHQFAAHPEDYTLFSIGTFDDETGKILYQVAESLGNGLEYIGEEMQHGQDQKTNSGEQPLADDPSIQPGAASEDPAL